MCTVRHIQNHMQNKQLRQWICTKFCDKLERSSTETIQMMQKAAAMGNWWSAASLKQRAHACITSTAKLVKHPVTQVTQHLYSQDLVPFDFWLFQKLKSPLKGRDFRSLMRFRKIRQCSWWRLGELCEVPRCLLWRGLGHHCPVQNVSVSCIFFNKCIYFFIVCGWILSTQTLYTIFVPACNFWL